MTQPSPSRPLALDTGLLPILQAVIGNTLLGVLFALFVLAAYRSWQSTGHVQMLLLALQEAIVVGLVVTRRRSAETSRSPWDWGVAVVGTAAPMLQRPDAPLHLALEPFGIAVQILGAGLSVLATVSLGRSFGIVAANRGVRTGGLYRFVRHPLYGSYLVGYAGFLLGNASPLNLLLVAVAAACQYLRGLAEERVLARDPAYAAYMARVRYRFLPYIF
ncbi:MAG TPA: isoprenylcysteine carboxylmethyltransferase family protein [Roseiflexaceae bacterium]|nr:isoprenylcysteine carboxylmethyltransferase family protein [Roseiflexaceae bacterium]